jgi:hypothetical protein
MYTELYDNRNMWYDALNDVHEHSKPAARSDAPDEFGDAHVSRFNQYFYAYLSCINEFNDDN